MVFLEIQLQLNYPLHRLLCFVGFGVNLVELDDKQPIHLCLVGCNH